jgi:hypothetical protein
MEAQFSERGELLYAHRGFATRALAVQWAEQDGSYAGKPNSNRWEKISYRVTANSTGKEAKYGITKSVTPDNVQHPQDQVQHQFLLFGHPWLRIGVGTPTAAAVSKYIPIATK